MRTGGDARNRDYVGDRFDGRTSPAIEALCFDPQPSGGLLAALDPGAAADLPADVAVVGRVEAGDPGLVVR